jgi:cyclophilin family peptidyl-prolyl cis-trans isomerase
MSKKTRQKQLAKLAARRAADRRRRRRNRAIAVAASVLLVLGAGGAVAWTLINEEPEGRQAQDGEQTPEPAVACGAKAPKAADPPKQFARPPKLDLKEGVDYSAILVTSCGKIEMDLYEDPTPVTVNSFVFLSKKGFYDGGIFHRTVDTPSLSVIQAGDPTGSGSGGPGYTFEDEFRKALRFDRPGFLALANPGTPDSNGSQFFITLNEPDHLNGKHTIFGEITSGLKVVRKINGIPTGPGDVPEKTIYIEKVIIRTA